ncbi:MAG TPA: hypothetical protein VGO62_12110 [Myxococcota bacterium]|jgi:D-alanine-D-alanine ligase
MENIVASAHRAHHRSRSRTGKDQLKLTIALAHNLRRSDDESEAELDSQASIDAIAHHISLLGHRVIPLCVDGPVSGVVNELERVRPDLVFNIAEGRIGKFREAFFPALFEQLGLPCTGSDAGTLAIAIDKALTKRIVGQPVAAGALALDRHALALAARSLTLPVIVKPNCEGSSKGITQKSVCRSVNEVIAVGAELLARYPAGVLVEEFVDGSDVAVAWLEPVGALAPAAFHYPVAAGELAIYDLALKGSEQARVTVEVPAQLPPALVRELERRTHDVMRALGIRDIGRVDWRIDRSGRPVFLEVNALPAMTPGLDHELYRAARERGLREPKDVLAAVIESALARAA